MRSWTENKFYDVINDREGIRVTGFSGHGSYWVQAALTPPGRSRRAQREHLLRLIDRAITRGDEPGEVAWSEPTYERPINPVFDPERY